MRAGSWLFFTGHMATDFEHGLAPAVAGKPGLPLGGAPRYRREGDFIIDRFAKLIMRPKAATCVTSCASTSTTAMQMS